MDLTPYMSPTSGTNCAIRTPASLARVGHVWALTTFRRTAEH
ncbi:hypothetical protein [Streptomyces sp. YGL11-2]